MTYSDSINATFEVPSQYRTYDSRLGVFARIQTNQYKVKKFTKYSGALVDTYYMNVCGALDKTYRPIYRDNSGRIFYYLINTEYNAKIINPNIQTVPTKASDFIQATNSNFSLSIS